MHFSNNVFNKKTPKVQLVKHSAQIRIGKTWKQTWYVDKNIKSKI
jgi:hypothetical protein